MNVNNQLTAYIKLTTMKLKNRFTFCKYQVSRYVKTTYNPFLLGKFLKVREQHKKTIVAEKIIISM